MRCHSPIWGHILDPTPASVSAPHSPLAVSPALRIQGFHSIFFMCSPTPLHAYTRIYNCGSISLRAYTRVPSLCVLYVYTHESTVLSAYTHVFTPLCAYLYQACVSKPSWLGISRA